MHKTLAIFQNVQDLQGFEKMMMREFMPRLLSVPGIAHIEITSMGPATQATPANLLVIQFVLTVYFESVEAQEEMLTTPVGLELVDIIRNNAYSDVGVFMSREKVIHTTDDFLTYVKPKHRYSETDERLKRLEGQLGEVLRILRRV